MAIYTETSRLDWLEMMANEPGGLLLHDGSESGRKGLGLRPGAMRRTLRQAIDDAMDDEITDKTECDICKAWPDEPCRGATHVRTPQNLSIARDAEIERLQARIAELEQRLAHAQVWDRDVQEPTR
jgi:hypothetical protein